MQKIKKGFIKNIVSALLAVTLAFPITLFAGCGLKSSDYTEKEHIKRVSERVEKRYFADDGKYEYTDYEVYPLYDENDQLTHFLVEFEPYGYVYIMIYETGLGLFGLPSMYLRNAGEDAEWRKNWSRYKISGDIGMHIEDNEKIWECDEAGKVITYNVSHFAAANIKDETRYFLKIKQAKDNGYIPAVKRGGKFFNLMSLEEMDYQQELDEIKYPTSNIYFVGKSAFDL